MAEATDSPCLVCGVPATRQCSRCHDATYCSREHQVRHWKVHKISACLCAKGKKMPADSNAEASFPRWMQLQFDDGRVWQARMQQMRQDFLSSTRASAEESPSAIRTTKGRTLNVPKTFPGNRREALRNLATHCWPVVPLDGDAISTRCERCNAKFVHRAAYFPCGQSPPRMNVQL
jgi:hypothetical protein